MKKMHIIGIVLIGVAISVMIVSLADSSTYVTFDEADTYQGQQFHVIGELAPDKDIMYDPTENPGQFSFYMKDDQGNVNLVVHNDAKPQDFERSDEVVVVGYMQDNGEFVAEDILMKCPSKYNEEFEQVSSVE